jgi:YidC/Oxa1 family membrane protein insertase
MEFFSLLSDSTITIWGQTYNIYLNWIGQIIRWLIESVGSVGVGVILFSLALKVIVMPFDVSQRVTMRKQNVKMKENQEKMAKLQKQYANNKDLYNQKVMEMYKESEFSMFSSCLPMILSMVIFIVAINAFNAYAQYAAVENYNLMVGEYNKTIQSYAPDLDIENSYVLTVNSDTIIVKGTGENAFVYYEVANTGDESAEYIKNAKKTYYVDTQKLMASSRAADVQTYLDMKDEQGNAKYSQEEACKKYMISLAQTEVLNFYEDEISERTKFLWMKNIWMTDASYKHPVSNYTDFETSVKTQKFDVGGEKVELTALTTDVYNQTTYDEVTDKLVKQKSQANGYFVLIVLSVGTILLQQWITMRSQKEQSQFSTVDGQGAQQQKTTMIMMTVMFAFFSFMYSGAFSIYMITSNLTSLASTLVINKIVDTAIEKKEQQAMQDKYNQRFPGRVYKGDAEKEDKKNRKNK